MNQYQINIVNKYLNDKNTECLYDWLNYLDQEYGYNNPNPCIEEYFWKVRHALNLPD